MNDLVGDELTGRAASDLATDGREVFGVDVEAVCIACNTEEGKQIEHGDETLHDEFGRRTGLVWLTVRRTMHDAIELCDHRRQQQQQALCMSVGVRMLKLGQDEVMVVRELLQLVGRGGGHPVLAEHHSDVETGMVGCAEQLLEITWAEKHGADADVEAGHGALQYMTRTTDDDIARTEVVDLIVDVDLCVAIEDECCDEAIEKHGRTHVAKLLRIESEGEILVAVEDVLVLCDGDGLQVDGFHERFVDSDGAKIAKKEEIVVSYR